jgi:alanine dehydrogenase
MFETADKVTTHDNPVYVRHGVLHYSVGNMPGAVPYTSTIALTNATLQYALQIAGKGITKAFNDNASLAKGLNTYNGTITYKAVADVHKMDFAEVVF